MADRQKVIKGIEACLQPGTCRECPYCRVYDTTIEKCAKEMMQDALELLKNEPLPVLNVGKCGIYFGDCPHCGKRVTKKNTSYCPYCGKRVTWG